MNTVRDHLKGDKQYTIITTDSFGEGLQMKGSDVDVMFVMNNMEVSEDTHIYCKVDGIYFTMEIEDTQPGFTKLRLAHCNYQNIFEDCEEIGSNFYFSNSSFKQAFKNNTLPTVHGPCVSDESGIVDCAYCLHSKLWIKPAKQWVTRSKNEWPCYYVKQTIVKHGVLFVPIGVKGSAKEDLEWRISFSVGEKMLINTFTHTQLLCYVLMKIVLKDIIDLDRDCKELLCSYFIKTILFWICEELPSSIWKPENLIVCYMRCLRRLIYCVEYKVCPHYFIPENNLFENKIQGHAQEALLKKLYILNSYGWKCILLSDQISNVKALAFDISEESSYLHVKSVENLLSNGMCIAEILYSTYYFLFEKVIYKTLSCKSLKIKYLYKYFLSKYCTKRKQLLPFDDISGNKSTYTQYNTYISTLLLNTRHDAVSGWLMLASFFYRRKHYNTVLYIVRYSLTKCSPMKLHKLIKLSDIYHQIFNLQLFKNMNIVQSWRFLLLDTVSLAENFTLVPEELQMIETFAIPPVVYAHTLCFLCHFRLHNRRQCWDTIRTLQWTIEANYYIENKVLKGLSYNILGICFQYLGDQESARQSFVYSTKLFPNQKFNIAFHML
ncbi:Hypothetical predicted protein [Mytilus galloprovincialis]|uniref:Mab-21-like HhH/H2TH-like domain-containing protein n=1 Tax=Mytilus galloprovincialis TaxID=29158 RepID=A0A8B6G534_MYTGA|nr:Hypothetical predicted protein [Mytilus galloprovincialis]